jgi:hypothetical protein
MRSNGSLCSGGTVEGDGVLTGDRQLAIAIIQETAAKKPSVSPKIASAEAVLDRDLPQAGRAEDRLILRIIEQPARGARQTLGVSGRPQQQVRVQQ